TKILTWLSQNTAQKHFDDSSTVRFNEIAGGRIHAERPACDLRLNKRLSGCTDDHKIQRSRIQRANRMILLRSRNFLLKKSNQICHPPLIEFVKSLTTTTAFGVNQPGKLGMFTTKTYKGTQQCSQPFGSRCTGKRKRNTFKLQAKSTKNFIDYRCPQTFLGTKKVIKQLLRNAGNLRNRSGGSS